MKVDLRRSKVPPPQLTWKSGKDNGKASRSIANCKSGFMLFVFFLSFDFVGARRLWNRIIRCRTEKVHSCAITWISLVPFLQLSQRRLAGTSTRFEQVATLYDFHTVSTFSPYVSTLQKCPYHGHCDHVRSPVAVAGPFRFPR